MEARSLEHHPYAYLYPYIPNQVEARSLELLCESLGSRSKNRDFNQIIHRVLGVAEQVRYCDHAANLWFDLPHRTYDAMTNPANCTWGFHPPPPLPESLGATCATDPEQIRARDRRRASNCAFLPRPSRLWQQLSALTSRIHLSHLAPSLQ